MTENTNKPKRKRSMTSIALSWLAERMRKTEEVKQAVSSGKYEIKVDQVAKAMIQQE